MFGSCVLDHVYFVHPLTNIYGSASTWCKTSLLCPEQCHLLAVLAALAVVAANISVDSRPICVGRHTDQHIGRALVDMLTKSGCPVDRLLTCRRYFTATYVLVTVSCIADII